MSKTRWFPIEYMEPETRAIKLKPCPFCGGEAKIVASQDGDDKETRVHTIGCFGPCVDWPFDGEESDAGRSSGGCMAILDSWAICDESLNRTVKRWNERAYGKEETSG